MKKNILVSIVIFIAFLLILAIIGGLFFYKDTSEVPEADVPVWEIGDTWTYEDTRLLDDESIETGFYVYDINSYEGEEFYLTQDFTSTNICYGAISTSDLNPITRDMYGDGGKYFTGMENKRFDFPLKVGKSWLFTDFENNTFSFNVNKHDNVEVPAGNFDTFKITQTNVETGNTERIYYYSEEVNYIVKEVVYQDGNKTNELNFKSFSNSDVKQKVSSEYIGGKLDATLEKWQWKVIHPEWGHEGWGMDWWEVRYSHNGAEHIGEMSGYFLKHALEWLRNNTHDDDKVLSWWDYGHAIRGFAQREPLVDAPSEEILHTINSPWDHNELDSGKGTVDVSTALVGTPQEAEQIMEETGAKFILVDSRMYPWTMMNTGILHAPILGAGRERDDYWTFKAQTVEGDIPIDEAERKAKENPSYEIFNKHIAYGDEFYDSLFYKAFIGYSKQDVPAMQSSYRLVYPVMHGWNLTHFKLVYKTAYYSPEAEKDESIRLEDYEVMNEKYAEEMVETQGGHMISGLHFGAIMLEYYKGASISGKVIDENGTPISDVRVTVQDEYGIPHDCTYTNEFGAYDLILPSGNIEIAVSTGGWSNEPDEEVSQQASLVESLVLNITKMDISEDQANRITDDWTIEDFDLIISENDLL